MAKLLGIRIFVVLVTLALSTAVIAQVPGIANKQIDPGIDGEDEWTDEDLRKAQPMPYPRFKNSELQAKKPRSDELLDSVPRSSETSQYFEAGLPDDALESDEMDDFIEPSDGSFDENYEDQPWESNRIEDVDFLDIGGNKWNEASDRDLVRTIDDEPFTRDVGTSGRHFTSSRLVPVQSDRSFPYRPIGKLFYRDQNNRGFQCSAALIGPRLILTAGHCVHDGSGRQSGYYRNFIFIPAFRNNSRPYGTWNWNWAIVSGPWYNGGDRVPNRADYGLIELRDNARGQRIGEVTGWMGWITHYLRTGRNLTLLGYPGYLDNGQFMHQVNSTAYQHSFSQNITRTGSDMGPGASGGPWVVNFGNPSAGQVVGRFRARNRVVGVESFGPTGPGNLPGVELVSGSSILHNTWFRDQLWNRACRRDIRNCRR